MTLRTFSFLCSAQTGKGQQAVIMQLVKIMLNIGQPVACFQQHFLATLTEKLASVSSTFWLSDLQHPPNPTNAKVHNILLVSIQLQ